MDGVGINQFHSFRFVNRMLVDFRKTGQNLFHFIGYGAVFWIGHLLLGYRNCVASYKTFPPCYGKTHTPVFRLTD